jgi:transcriptional regulator with XRE-family HTH domain
MKERLKLFLAMEGLSPSQFADKLGIQRSGVSHLLSGRNKPSFEFISRMLATYPRLNPDWLIMGTGKAYRDMPGAEITPQAVNEDNTVSEAPLQETSVTNDLTDLFSAPKQPAEPDIPAPAPKVEPQPVKPPVKPAPGKRIAQITIFYTDGTYEIR